MNRRFGVVSLIGLPLAVVLALAGCTPADWEAGASAPVPTATSTSPTPTPTASAKPDAVDWEATPATCAALKAQIVVLRIDGGVLMNRITDRLNACSLLVLPQCRVDAIMAYMAAMGFQDDEFVVGEDNVDFQDPRVQASGVFAFGIDGADVTSRKKLQAVFESKDPAMVAAVKRTIDASPSIPRALLLNSLNWEVVQTKVDTLVLGYSGLVDGTVVTMGNRNSVGGDAAWIFIDPRTCTVPAAEVQPSDGEPGDPPTVILIRVGCINPGGGLKPKNPREDVLVNPNVDSFYKPGDERQTAGPDNYQGTLQDVLAEEERKRLAAIAEAQRPADIAEAARKAAEASTPPAPPATEAPQPQW